MGEIDRVGSCKSDVLNPSIRGHTGGVFGKSEYDYAGYH